MSAGGQLHCGILGSLVCTVPGATEQQVVVVVAVHCNPQS